MEENNLSDETITRLHIAYNIPEKRGSLGLLGEKLGVASSVISGWRAPNRRVPKEKIAIARADTGVRKEWLVHGEGEMRQPPEIKEHKKTYNGFDWDLHDEIATMIGELREELHINIKPGKLGGLIKMIYTDSMAGNEVTRAKVIQLIKLAA